LVAGEYWAGNQTMDADTAAAYEQFVAESHARVHPNGITSRCQSNGWSYQQ